jgi:hypothetical protein
MLGLLRDISAFLAARSVPHALVGAAALAVHGVSRSTFDVDLFTTDASVLSASAWGALLEQGVGVDTRVGDYEDALAGVVRFSLLGQRSVDLVVGRHQAWQKGVLTRATPFRLGDVELPVATPADLVLLKLFAGGPQDAWDIEQLLAVVGRAVVAPAIEATLPSLPPEAAELWARLSKAGRR